MAGVGAVFAELERALIGQRTAEALRMLRAAGRVYGPVPYGFSAVEGLLVGDPVEQRVLARIRRLRARGYSYQRVADRLNSDGVPAKRGSQWFGMSVRSVLRTCSGVATAEVADAA